MNILQKVLGIIGLNTIFLTKKMVRMYKHFVFLFLSIFVLSGCKSELNHFNEEALISAKDNTIDQNEYQKLFKLIEISNENEFTIFKVTDGKIDSSKVLTYLLKFFAANKLTLTSTDIWQPESPDLKFNKFNICVFLENSASIDGYVGDNSSFKTTIFKLLTDLKNFPLTDSLNLNYINTKTIPVIFSASRDDIDDFYKRLNPSDFKSAGGMRGSTDIEKMIKHLLDKLNPRNLSVFISDCVFSPGKKDAKKYLDGQYAALYNDFIAAKNINPDLSLIILQCTAKFEGTYFDYLDKPHLNINTIRPFYIWFIGSSEQIESLVEYKILELIKGGYKNELVIQAIEEVNQPNYKILYAPKIGNFDSKLLSKGTITDASVSNDNQNKGLFGFSVAVDYSNSLQDANHFLDTSNFKLSNPNYILRIETITDKSNLALRGFTHILKLQTSDLRDETLIIELIGKTPSWVYNSTSTDDTRIEIDDLEKQKTFGLKYLVEGVVDAFYPKSNSNTVSSISIVIKK